MRRRMLVALLVLVPALSAGADDAGKDAERARKIEAAKAVEAKDTADFQARVNEAIDRGVAWLKGRQKTSTGGFPGMPGTVPGKTYNPMDLGINSLVLLTLAKSGVPADDKAVERLQAFCKVDYADMKSKKNVKVYSAAVLLMAFDAMYNPGAKDETTVVKDRYGTTATRKKTPCKYPAAASSLIEELVRFLVGSQTKVGGWRYPGNDVGAPAGDVDLSNTQYALLGLNAAARCGVSVPVEVFTKALEYVLREQEKDGLPTDLWIENAAWEPGLDDVPKFQAAGKRKARGWTYLPGLKEPSTGAMTTAGIACLAIVKERLGEAGKLTPQVSQKIDVAILDGLAWLTDTFTVTDNPVMPPAPAMWHYYYLYGLERVGSLTGIRYVGKNAWYRLGADHLMAAQEKSGGWKSAAGAGKPADNTESEIVQTCFALLFLKRATTPPAVPITPPMLTGDPDAPPVDNRGDPVPPPPGK